MNKIKSVYIGIFPLPALLFLMSLLLAGRARTSAYLPLVTRLEWWGWEYRMASV